jgi:nucleosome binding factor SPN SPT16 subunit
LKTATKKSEKNYGIQIMETVIVHEKGQEVLTSGSSISLSDISYELGEDEEENKQRNKNPSIFLT